MGTITNSDLELISYIVGFDVLAMEYDVHERTLHQLSDNTPTLGWAKRGSISVDSSATYLLQLHAVHQCLFQYLAHSSHIPGLANTMANACSQLWELSDDELLTCFEIHFPQTLPWKLCHPRAVINSAWTLALSKEWFEPASLSNELTPPMPTSEPGPNFVNNSAKILRF
jgi:hypothetical protein